MTGTVYVVDDDPSMCDLIRATLERAGIPVKTFPSAEAFAGVASQLATESSPACLLLDLVMPGKSGLEFLEGQGQHEFPFPIVMMTAAGTIDTAVKSMKLGAVDFLKKPFTPEELVKVVQEALQRSQTTHADASQKSFVRSRLARLSPRERELLDAIVAGNSTKMVADRLGISARTVDHHRASLMEKMQASNVADLVRMAVEADYKTVA